MQTFLMCGKTCTKFECSCQNHIQIAPVMIYSPSNKNYRLQSARHHNLLRESDVILDEVVFGIGKMTITPVIKMHSISSDTLLILKFMWET